MRTPKFLGLAILLAAAVSAQDKPQLKARELFYTPITETASTKETPPKISSVKPPKPKPARPNQQDEQRQQASTGSTTTLPDGGRLQQASQTQEVVGPPFALKYRILKRTEESRYDEVDTETVFHSGDKIRVSVEANDHGYLYIVQQGSSKTWNLLFPNDEFEHGNNHIRRNQEYDIPGRGQFGFDEQPGAERLFIVMTRKPQADLEKLIYSLSKENPTRPASGTTSEERPKMMLAQNRIDNSLVDRLRGVMARDLVFEKVNDDKPVSSTKGIRKEKATYVATTDRTSGARLVVDLTLKHE